MPDVVLVGWLLLIGGGLCWVASEAVHAARRRRARRSGRWQTSRAPAWLRLLNPAGLVLAGVGAVYLISRYV